MPIAIPNAAPSAPIGPRANRGATGQDDPAADEEHEAAANRRRERPVEHAAGARRCAVTARRRAGGVGQQGEQPVGGRVRIELVARDRLVQAARRGGVHAGREPVADPLRRGSPSTWASARVDARRACRRAAAPVPVQQRDELRDALAGRARS